jgi:sulfite exporter TauE/SafE
MPELLLPAAFAAGFFGSTHCLAMCGGIVLLFEGVGAPSPRSMLRRLGYHLGRLLFYMVLGALAGASGALLTSGFTSSLAVLRVVAAVLLVLLGLNLLLDLRSLQFLESAGSVLWKKISPLTRYVLPISSVPHALAAGFLWGALPCGLVYSAVALAATGGSAVSGATVMLAFWAGTVPALFVVGTSAGSLGRWKNKRALRVAAGLLMILFGAIALALPFMRHDMSKHEGHGAAAASSGSVIYRS